MVNDLYNQVPGSPETEMCLLSALIQDRAMRDQVIPTVKRAAFFDPEHAIIFDAIKRLHFRGADVDGMTLREELIRARRLRDVGGLEYLAKVVQSAPSASHAGQYAAIMAEKHRLRSLQAACIGMLTKINAPAYGDRSELLCRELVERVVNEIITDGTSDTSRPIGDVIGDTIAAKLAGGGKRIPTGMQAVDSIVGGLRAGNMTVIGARPGMGKSAIIKQMALNVAAQGITCGIISIEEDNQKIAENLLANIGRVENRRIAYNTCDAQDWHRIYAAQLQLEKLPIRFDDQPVLLSQVEAAVARFAGKHGCKVVFVDYLQLIDPEQDRHGTRENEVRKLSNALKLAFKRFGVAGVVAAQLNRAAGGEPPTLANLRESGAIEQDADLAILLHREDYYRWGDPGYQPTHVLEAIIAKNKSGPVGKAALHFDARFQQISDAPTPAPTEEEIPEWTTH